MNMFWANKGRQIALQRAASQRPGGGGWGPRRLLCWFTLLWALVWFSGAIFYFLRLPSSSSSSSGEVAGVYSSASSAGFVIREEESDSGCLFVGPISFSKLAAKLGGEKAAAAAMAGDCVGDCQGMYASLEAAQTACLDLVECAAIVFHHSSSKYELRANAETNPFGESGRTKGSRDDGKTSWYLKKCDTDGEQLDLTINEQENQDNGNENNGIKRIQEDSQSNQNKDNDDEVGDDNRDDNDDDDEDDEDDDNDQNENDKEKEDEDEGDQGREEDGDTIVDEGREDDEDTTKPEIKIESEQKGDDQQTDQGRKEDDTHDDDDEDDDEDEDDSEDDIKKEEPQPTKQDPNQIIRRTIVGGKPIGAVIEPKETDALPPPPEFWIPPSGENLDSIGSMIDGQPTIFVGIASYRDNMCHETIEMIFDRAKYPSRVFVGAVDQRAEGDLSCIHTELDCESDPKQTLCRYRDHIQVHQVHAKHAAGPTFGRHRADALYRGEYYALQIDAHMYFIKEWDESAIAQWQAAKNEYAVLSNYPTDSSTSIDEMGNSRSKSTPTICDSAFVGNMLKHASAWEFTPPRFFGAVEPILSPFWGAGVSFSRGHRIVRVPYDCCLSMMFDGEETSMLIRMWTHGYDIYTFHSSIVFHPYFRKARPPMFWENESRHPGDARASEARVLKILGVAIGSVPAETNPEPSDVEEKYRLGKKRQAAQFWKIFGIDFEHRKIRSNCHASTMGYIHQALTPFIRSDRKGIDYSVVPTEEFERQSGFEGWKRMADMATNNEGIYREFRSRQTLKQKASQLLRRAS